jgi:hypothetical protein
MAIMIGLKANIGAENTFSWKLGTTVYMISVMIMELQ